MANGIRAMRERAGLTQEEVAAHFGLDHSTVVGWEAGKWMPKTKRLVQLANLLDCTIDDLLRDKK